MEFSRDDFRKREKKVNICTSIKKRFNPLESNIKPFPDSILLTTVPKPEIDFVRGVITCKPVCPV